MLISLCTESKRVIGLSFHSKRPLILASINTGVIQMWDYCRGTLIDRFDEHVGPVRGVHFHLSEPLFVSGGDDRQIRVWNYTMPSSRFTLLGHNDYIRTVQFHHENPWIVSASDDHTIRIWNWQSRVCISVLTGHTDHVMSASFHPMRDLIVSASLDQTVRVWDIEALKNKAGSPVNDILDSNQMRSDVFGDAVVKHVLEGHDGGVNWAAFHPTEPLIVSGADDHLVKLWRVDLDGPEAREVYPFRGHMDKVSCVLFHVKQGLIISNSKDRSIRVWDHESNGIQTIRRDHDRFWILAAHPEMNLLAAGHDRGMIVFKLGRDRPAYAYNVSKDAVVYLKDYTFEIYDFTIKRTFFHSIRRFFPNGWKCNRPPRTLTLSPRESEIVMCFDAEGGSSQLFDLCYGPDLHRRFSSNKGSVVAFVAHDRFAVLVKGSNLVSIHNLRNELVENHSLPIDTDAIFYAGTDNLLCKAEDRVVLFDLQQRVVLGELQIPFVKYIVWSKDMENVALLSKHAIVTASKKLVHQCTLHETIRIKSGAWDENGVFIYSTPTHIKYCLPNGDCGIIRALNIPMYIIKVSENTVFYFDRDAHIYGMVVDATEYVFKLALMQKKYDRVMSMIKSSKLVGQAMIAYLQQKGFPEVALHLVKDEKTRFNLAIESGNSQVAVASAKEIDEKEHWDRLGLEALRQGNVGIAEYAYQRTENLERLSFLYLITGNMDKLSKMLKTAEVKNDVMGQFHNALYLGNISERVKILENSGHLPLAHVTASVHGLRDNAKKLETELGDDVPSLPEGKTPSLLIPPAPVSCGGDWPLLSVMRGIFEGGLNDPGTGGAAELLEEGGPQKNELRWRGRSGS